MNQLCGSSVDRFNPKRCHAIILNLSAELCMYLLAVIGPPPFPESSRPIRRHPCPAPSLHGFWDIFAHNAASYCVIDRLTENLIAIDLAAVADIVELLQEPPIPYSVILCALKASLTKKAMTYGKRFPDGASVTTHTQQALLKPFLPG